jgi:hypothetical protein
LSDAFAIEPYLGAVAGRVDALLGRLAEERRRAGPARLADALGWVRDGIITDTKTAFGLLHWAQFGTKK